MSSSSKDIAGSGVDFLERVVQLRTGLYTEMLADLEAHLPVLRQLARQIDQLDAERNLALMLFHDLANSLDGVLGHSRIGNFQRDLLHLLLADAVERHDLQRVEL